MKRFVLVALTALLLVSCGQGKKSKQAAVASRDFPPVEVPMMITEPYERCVWLSMHMWDRFTDRSQLYTCDSLTVNGVKIESLEPQMGIFGTILQQIPIPEGQRAMENFYGLLDAFQREFPASNMLPQMAGLTSKYFYDPNSPFRSEDLYLPFVKSLAESPLIDQDYRMGYDWDARMCALNSSGSIAADFEFIDVSGKRRTLHSINASAILLIFGNPDCEACKEIMETFENIPELGDLITSGRLKVVDIYIDEDIELWKAKKATYPSTWINGYDPSFVIRTDLIYNVRAVPSLYLLDKDKRVVLKDCTPEAALSALLGN